MPPPRDHKPPELPDPEPSRFTIAMMIAVIVAAIGVLLIYSK